MSYVDLHLHLLPGVDDGPPDEAASLVHAERLAREGVHEATVTPHIGHPDYPLDVATIAERTRALQAAIATRASSCSCTPAARSIRSGRPPSRLTTST